MCLRNANEGIGSGMRQAAAQIANTDSGVYQHRHCTGLEQGEGQCEKIQAGRDHQGGTYAASNARSLKRAREAATGAFQFGEAELFVSHRTLRVPTIGADHRGTRRLQSRHLREMRGDIRHARDGAERNR